MKRIFIAVALVLSVMTMSAQPKTEALTKAIDKAQAAANDAKKAVKADTWIKLAKAYIDAYEAPATNVMPGTPQVETKLFLKDQKVLETVQRTTGEGETYTVDVYADKELWFNPQGILDFYLVTKPVAENGLAKAQEALLKASEVDAKGAKAQDIKDMMEKIHSHLYDEALYNYLAGNLQKSADLFGQTAKAYDNPVLSKTDNQSVYYNALVANLAGDTKTAIEKYNQCLANGFYQEGSLFSNLAEIHRLAGDVDKAKDLLTQGFEKFPESQGILVGLINLYIESKEEPTKLFDLLHSAQKNEPNNPSLYYVEGNVYKELGDIDNAVKMYNKSVEIDPGYVFGPFSIGMLYYDHAVDIQNLASEEYDDAKYMALVKQFEETLQSAIAPFETTYAMTDDPEVKSVVAEYLKNIYFRFRDKGDEYQKAYEKYSSLTK